MHIGWDLLAYCDTVIYKEEFGVICSRTSNRFIDLVNYLCQILIVQFSIPRQFLWNFFKIHPLVMRIITAMMNATHIVQGILKYFLLDGKKNQSEMMRK